MGLGTHIVGATVLGLPVGRQVARPQKNRNLHNHKNVRPSPKKSQFAQSQKRSPVPKKIAICTITKNVRPSPKKKSQFAQSQKTFARPKKKSQFAQSQKTFARPPKKIAICTITKTGKRANWGKTGKLGKNGQIGEKRANGDVRPYTGSVIVGANVPVRPSAKCTPNAPP